MKVRRFDLSEDYAILKDWWNAHGSFPPKPEHLSSTGIIVEVEEKPSCAGFVYQTDSKICVFEFVVSNPKIDKKSRSEALEKLIATVQAFAEKMNYSLIYTSINIEAYISKLKKHGFIEIDKNQTHMFYEVVKEDV